MTKNGDEHALKHCLLLIESKLGWGSSETWTNYDFEKLSEEINSGTNVRLSLTTLKRIWGKLKYDSAPTLTTLNTLAQFAGYADWRIFKQAESVASESTAPAPQPAEIPAPAAARTTLKRYWLLLLIPLSVLGYALVPSKVKLLSTKPNPSQFAFQADKIRTEGVPNSVVFQYNAQAAKSDSVFIAQSWDISRKILVPKDKQVYSSIYYYPGYFNAKLIADHEVVKTHDLWITSDGWLCLAENKPIPVYFKKEECIQNGIVQVNDEVLRRYNLSLHPEAPKIRIFNQRDLGDLMSDNFTFETYLKNDFSQGANACQPTQVLIQCKNDIINIPLAAKACIGDLRLAFCGAYLTSQDSDLSGFGTDLTQWTKLRVETVDKKATIYVNDRKAYTLDFPNEATGIVGVQYRFNGTGAVRDTRFENNGKVTRL